MKKVYTDGHCDDQQEERIDRIEYGERKRNIEFRQQRFFLTRERDENIFNEIMQKGLKAKRGKIRKQAETYDHIAGYAPAGSGNGTPWFNIGPRNINGRVKSLAVHPTDEDIVYAGAASGGVWKTTDGGQSWLPLMNDEDTLSIGSVAIAPTNTDIIYAGSGEWTPGWGPNVAGLGLFVSTDAGNTWTLRNTMTNNVQIARVLVSPTDADTVYIAGPNGFEVSTDQGANWTTLRAGAISDAVIDSSDEDVIYINVRFDKIYKTTDGGTSWNDLNNGPTGTNAAWVKLDIGRNGTNGTNFIVAKKQGTVSVSTDGGANWTILAGSHGNANHDEWANLVAVSPHDEDIILAGGVSIQRTADGGTGWANLAGLHADHQVGVFALSDNNRVYTCNDGGVYRSDDKGATFKKMSHGLIVTQFNDIGSWSRISNVLGGGTQDQGTNMTTGGLTYKKIFGWDGGYFVVDPNDPRTMYAEHQATEIFKSVDGGANWVQKIGGITGSGPWVGVITMDPNNSSRLYTGTQQVFRSTDALATDWVSSSQAIGGDITSIAVAKADSNRVYAASSFGVLLRSDDAGVTNPWLVKTGGSFPSRPLKDVVVDDADEDRVFVCFAGTSGGAANSVWRSTNGGDAWTDISGDLPDISMNALALDPNDSNTYYVGGDVGVYKTTDGGTTWAIFDNGIPNVMIADLHIDPEEEVLYAATFGRGMYKLNIAPGAVINTRDIYVRDSLLDTGEIYPSPSGEPNPNDPAKNVYWWQSPDVKTDVSPFYAQDALFDGVEFDNELGDEDPERTNVTRFYAQVHNRGWQDSSNVKVRAFIADASAGLPNLPADFWTVFPNSDPADVSIWTPLGPARNITTLAPHTPKIVSWDYTLPMSTATHTCMLVAITSGDDPITTTELNVNNLVKNEKRVALRNLHVINDPGPAPMNMISSINFHNALDTGDLLDILIDPSNMRAGNIGLMFQKGVTIREENLDGVVRYPLADGEYIGDWYRTMKDNDIDISEILKDFDTTQIFDFSSAKRSSIMGLEVKKGEYVKALIVSKASTKADPRYKQTFDILQRQKGEIIGGSTFKAQRLEPKNPKEASKIRVMLKKVKIINDLDPWIKGKGEVVFNTEVSFNEEKCRSVEKRFPKEGCYKMSDKGDGMYNMDVCLFEGYVSKEDNMKVTISPIEFDTFDPDDPFVMYDRMFTAPYAQWTKLYKPGDEPTDPESMSDWKVWLTIEEL